MPSIGALPQELVDNIIDSAGVEDKRAAASLALTCNSWTPRSSKHLFNAVNILTTHLAEFLAQAAESSRLASHVTELSISQPLRGDDGFDLTLFIPTILSTFPRLSSLSIFGERISIQSGLLPTPSARRPHFSLLRLSHTHVEALPEFLQVFGQIETLHLDQVYIPPNTCLPESGYGRHLRVTNLFFDGSRPTFDALTLLLEKSSLKKLHLKCDMFFRIHTAAVNAFLRNVGQNLEHFRFDLPMDGWVVEGPEMCDLVELSRLRSLRSVEIVSPRRAIRRRGTTVSKMLWLNMHAALAYIPPCVQHVRLSVNLYHVHPIVLADCDYSRMESKLARCSSLKSLEINLTTEQDGQVVPVGAPKSAEVLDAVRSKMSERMGSVLRLT